MADLNIEIGFASVNNARIYYEIAGAGTPFIMIHAGVADSRQWNNEFPYFAQHYRVLRYDLRGYGKSEPVDGDFSHLLDLAGLVDTLGINQPAVFLGCSMGGGLAMNFALENPSRTKALIMAGSGPNGLELDPPTPQDFKTRYEQAENAYNTGDLDRLAELETQIWFDGLGRSPEQVDPVMRKLAYEMNRHDLDLNAKKLGKVRPDMKVPAAERLGELQIPVLIIIGEHDTPYILAAGDYMEEKINTVNKVMIKNAAHLSNMDQPRKFQRILDDFLRTIDTANK